MTTYLVDFENVKSDGLNGIDNLAADDRIIIFYSINADKISFDLHRKMNETKAKIDLYNVEVGHKNALDFQLASYLGYLIAQDGKANYAIVSNDNGYGPLVTFWTKANFKVKLIHDLKNVYRYRPAIAEKSVSGHTVNRQQTYKPHTPQQANPEEVKQEETIQQEVTGQETNIEKKADEHLEVVRQVQKEFQQEVKKEVQQEVKKDIPQETQPEPKEEQVCQPTSVETVNQESAASAEVENQQPSSGQNKNTNQNHRGNHNNSRKSSNQKSKEPKAAAPDENDELYQQVKSLVEGEEEAKLLTEYIKKYKTKQGLNNAIVKVYGSTVGGNLYKQIKPLILDKKGK